MFYYIIRRILISIPLLLGISLLTFLLIQKTPGNFFDSLKLNPQISPETIARYEHLYHLDKPLIEQYFEWLKSLLRLDLGYSFFYNVPVKDVISGRLVNTLILSISSLIFTWLIAIPLGIWAAFHRNKIGDRILALLSFAGLSTPSFFLAILLLYAVGQWGILPLGGMHSANYEDLNFIERTIDLLRHLVIPDRKSTRLNSSH